MSCATGGGTGLTQLDRFNIVVLPGDGIGALLIIVINTRALTRPIIGPEVVGQALRVLTTVQAARAKSGLKLEIERHDFGGIAIDNHGNPLPDSTLAACKAADAILMGEIFHQLDTLLLTPAVQHTRLGWRTEMGCWARPS